MIIKAAEKQSSFKKGNLSVNTNAKCLADACERLKIRGVFNRVTCHSFRATAPSRAYAACFDDASVALRTGHRDVRSLRACLNLRGEVGRELQAAIFGQTGRRRPSRNHRASGHAVPVPGGNSGT